MNSDCGIITLTMNLNVIHPMTALSGKAPEDYLILLASLRVDYYFMKITNRTNKMIEVFWSALENAEVSTSYVVRDCKDPATLVPAVLESIASSYSRSSTAINDGCQVPEEIAMQQKLLNI